MKAGLRLSPGRKRLLALASLAREWVVSQIHHNVPAHAATIEDTLLDASLCHFGTPFSYSSASASVGGLLLLGAPSAAEMLDTVSLNLRARYKIHTPVQRLDLYQIAVDRIADTGWTQVQLLSNLGHCEHL